MKDKNSMGAKGDKAPVKAQPPKKQLLNEKAEEYLREGGNIEDLPNPQDEVDIKIKTNQPGKK